MAVPVIFLLCARRTIISYDGHYIDLSMTRMWWKVCFEQQAHSFLNTSSAAIEAIVQRARVKFALNEITQAIVVNRLAVGQFLPVTGSNNE